MKKWPYIVGIGAVALSMALLLPTGRSTGFAYLSDAEGGSLIGGCNSVNSGTTVCYSTKTGCVNTIGVNPPTTFSGSWQPDTPLNCGVSECGTVPQNKTCGG
jgi:hypothetical protein